MKNAIIWGAAGGIGTALLSELKVAGWTAIAVARETREIDSLADHAFEADFADPVSIEQTVYSISQKVESFDLWCYAAGDILSSKVSEMAPEDWDRIISANLSGAYAAIHYSLALLSEEAHIVLLGAVSERLRLPGLSAYAAAKAGLEAFADSLSKEQRKKRITIVRPGVVATPLWEKIPLRMPADAAPPGKIARKILEAYESGHKGQLDLV